jgi:low affinity Fe/Cu permease
MALKNRSPLGQVLESFSRLATRATGTSSAFILACLIILIWGITGPIFHFSDTWQLVINTGTTIVTFLMVFLIQRSQNKDAMAMHLKLNELVAAIRHASNRLIDVEDLTEEEIETLHKHYQRLVARSKEEFKLAETHSEQEAEARHEQKRRHREMYLETLEKVRKE